MITIDFSGKSVLITGGTRGIGLASALEFGRAGARTYLTYKWGQDDYNVLYAAFEKAGAPKPVPGTPTMSRPLGHGSPYSRARCPKASLRLRSQALS